MRQVPTGEFAMSLRGLIPVAALLLAGCAGSGDSAANRSVWVADGPPVNCISRHQVRTFRVVDDRTIDFERNRNQAWRNNLPFRCSGLTFGQAIQLNNRTSSSRICSFDTITPRSLAGGPNPVRCQLGQFQPMKRVPVPEAPAAPTTG
jgi:hypothetical protein